MILKVTVTLFVIGLSSLSNLAQELETEIAVYDSTDSYYRYFVTKKLLVNHQEKLCQILTYPSFGTPNVYVVEKDKELSKSFIFHRKFQNDELWQEFSKKLVDEKKDYFDKASVISVLDQLNTDVIQKKVEIHEESRKVLSGKCEKLVLFNNIEAPPSFDGITTYVTIYVNSEYKVNKFKELKFEELFLLKNQLNILFNSN